MQFFLSSEYSRQAIISVIMWLNLIRNFSNYVVQFTSFLKFISQMRSYRRESLCEMEYRFLIVGRSSIFIQQKAKNRGFLFICSNNVELSNSSLV